MANPFVHFNLHTSDVAKARGFYQELFAWKFTSLPTPKGIFTLIDVGGGTGGGMMKNPAPGAPSHWLAAVAVDDIEATVKRVEELGGTIVEPVTKLGFIGSMCIIQDPTGAHLALFERKRGLF